MVSGSAHIGAAVAVMVLIASALWAELRFSRHAKLPAHFNFAGRATRFAPRSFVIWLTPAIFVALIGLLVWSVRVFPPEYINGDPETAVIVSSVVVVAAQFFILWLITRWARNEGRS